MQTCLTRSLLWLALALSTASCGGSGSTSTGNSAVSTTISGNVVKGPVTGATVTVKNALTGQVLGTTISGTGGAYTLAVAHVGDVVVEVNGGTYTDEATGSPTGLNTPLKVVLLANGGTVTGMVTPLTTMAYMNAFPNASSAVNSAAFTTMAAELAKQFQLQGVDLTKTLPMVSGATNDYGKVLAGLSKYLQLNSAQLQTAVGTALSSPQWAQFSDKFTAAYKAAYPTSNITYALSGNTVSIGGTGVGGGAGVCGVAVTGNVNLGTMSTPLNLNLCITGLTGGSCSASDASLAKVLTTQSALANVANLNYAYSAMCAPDALTIKLQ